MRLRSVSSGALTVALAAGEIVDHYEWTSHAPTTYGRIPDMTGDFEVTGEPSRSSANIARGEVEPIETSPWPHDPLAVTPVDPGGDFADEDMSGIDIAADGTAYVVNNGTGTLYALGHDQMTGEYEIAFSATLAYPDGGGTPDAEGVTVGPDGAIYVATERDNDESNVSRPSVLRFEPPADGDVVDLTATDEYDLSDHVGQIGANSGPEAVQYLPDAWGGAFAVGVEATGDVHFVQFGDDGAVNVLQTFEPELNGVMALDYEENTGILRVVCDEVCEGRSLEMTFDGEQFTTDGTLYARPEALDNNAYEGYASITETVECAEGGSIEQQRFLWADDAVTDGYGLRGAVSELGDCSGNSDVAGSLETGSHAGSNVLAPSLGSFGEFGIDVGSDADLAPLPAS